MSKAAAKVVQITAAAGLPEAGCRATGHLSTVGRSRVAHRELSSHAGAYDSVAAWSGVKLLFTRDGAAPAIL